jgi:ubiquinone/menaquinone biosynthesis C-methylase UbiE
LKHTMKDQWDRISTENAFFGVLSRDGYENPDAVDAKQFWKTGREDVESFMKLLDFDNSKPLHMLEIGCGLGRMTQHFSSLFGKIYAVDVSEEMLSRAKGYWGHLHNVEWILGSGESLQPMASESVDLVFSVWVLQHIPDPNAVLNYIRESERVLKRNGVALLQFRVIPTRSALPALKYLIFTHWPSPVTKFLIRIWDAMKGHSGLRAKFAREYEAWRGCALRASAIEAVAAKTGLQILGTGNLGRQSPGTQSVYYIFRKTGDY